ncbi:MAG: hypothetical protein ACD_81C00114G0006 [uncultured bacterium]|uniref:Efflux transporter, RND family, MFP subunit n=1 Tax=Candidatus Wolfebacteria bacterium GW2011_GWE2_44_13 TaxID=1619017 RepID=A0A0G1HA40_9BACT|nr:MAG: hypothetical protein ACD_81C00114G0006 [uncultured bacterium]KKT43615.1 MAG: Efflux transporter, RND family, MFP subunit [Candidatus Wolfebacteria bacterium GW2011_GWE2_44_13]
MHSIKEYFLAHKIISIVTLIVVVFAGYWGYGKLTDTSAEPRYVTAAVEKGTLITSITGTGQVSASNQVELKAKASGDITTIAVVNGQEVKVGALIVQLDARDAQKAVRDAEVNLQSAKLSLEKLRQPADTLSVIQSENALAQAQQTKQNAEDDIKKAYDDGFNAIANTFLDIPTIMTGLDDVFFYATIDKGMPNISWYINQTSIQVAGEREKAMQNQDDFYAGYNASRAAYTKNFDAYKAASRTSSTQTIEALIDETYMTTRTIADTVKAGNNLIDFVKDSLTRNNVNATIPATVDAHKATLNTYTGTTNAHLLSLLALKSTLKSSRDAIINADRTIAEKTEYIADLKSGTDPLDLQAQELTVRQRENALLDAREKLADYYLRAPFSGTIATLSIKSSDSISSGSSIATLITKQKLAEISLNEVDVAKVKVGQKATLAFDAVEGLSISGAVAEIDTVGAVSQGVVTYVVKIGFDTQDERVKPGMSVSAAIITEMKSDVLTVPNSAVKTQDDISYVEMFEAPLENATGTQGAISLVAPQRKTVTIGISNDTMTEIVSGLQEGDQIITRTITSSNTTTQTAPSIFSTGGARMGR